MPGLSPRQDPRHNLPLRLGSFVGRTREIAEISRLLTTTRLLTLTGSPGVGKTRLALEAAECQLGSLTSGVWLVELASLTDPALVLQVVAAVFGVSEQAGRPLLQTLADALRGQHLLLVLDNCEHLIDACAELSDQLLRACPHLMILATSREPLGIVGEMAWRVPSLTVPDPDVLAVMGSAGPAAIGELEAVRLFAERARSAWPSFTLTATNAAAVARICWRLDGIPLALELAAARVAALSVEQIADRLDDRFRLLTGRNRTALPRQRTLRAAVAWSHELLSEPERALLRRLAVFAGGWMLEAAEAVCAWDGIEATEVLDLLQHLVDKSLVIAEARADGSMRYRMLETLQQYASEQLVESGELDEARRQHAVQQVTVAEQAQPELRGPRERAWLVRLEEENDNLRAALRWTINRCEAELALRLASALWRFWSVRGHLVEGSGWLEQALALDGEPGSSAVLLRARAAALNGAGNLAQARGEYPRSAVFLEESLALSRRLDDTAGEATALHNLGLAARMRGDRQRARAYLNESLGLFRTLGDTRNAGLSLLNLGRLSHDDGDLERATTHVAESLALLRMAGSAQGTATALNRLGELARDHGDVMVAVRFHDEALAIHRDRADPWGIGLSLLCLARVALVRPDYAQALELASQSLRALAGVGADRDTAAALVVVATSLCATGQAGIGAELLGAVAQAFPEGSLIGAERVGFERAMVAATAALSETAFASAWASARQHTLDQVVERVLKVAEEAAPEPSGPAPAAAPSASLTRREREVAALVARGFTNREIADALTISEMTADSHVSHILRKLRFRSRAQVAAWAAQHGLATPDPD